MMGRGKLSLVGVRTTGLPRLIAATSIDRRVSGFSTFRTSTGSMAIQYPASVLAVVGTNAVPFRRWNEQYIGPLLYPAVHDMALTDNDFLDTGLHGSAIAPIRLTKKAGADTVDPGVQEIAPKDEGAAPPARYTSSECEHEPRGPQPHHARGLRKITVRVVLVG